MKKAEHQREKKQSRQVEGLRKLRGESKEGEAGSTLKFYYRAY